jgi:hypothetical protein
MKITTGTARRLLRAANPAPGDALAGTARDSEGALTAIFGSADADVIAFDAPEGAGPSAGRARWRPELPRLRWWTAIPAALLTAALAAALVVVLLVTGSPAPGNSPGSAQAASGTFVELVANLTAHPGANQGDASTELSMLADVAAAQPTPALGPVEYSRAESWGLDLGTTHYGLSYRSHDTSLQESWMGSDGAYLGVETWPGGKIPPGIIPVQRSAPSAQGAAAFAKWYDPARLPTSAALMRQHLIGMSCPTPGGPCFGGQNPTTEIVTEAETLMGSEPLPPAARSAILGALADTAAHPGARQAFYDLGSVSDRVGHKAVAIAYEYQQGDTAPAAVSGGGSSCATSTSGGGTTITCSGSAYVSGSGSGPSDSPSATPSATSRPPGRPSSPAPGSTSPSPSISVSGEGSTGRAGAGGLPSDFMESSLVVLVFDPDTGALLGEEYAYCNAPVEAHLATGKCFATSYDQFLEIKAVASVPARPAGPGPADTPGSGSPSTLPTNTP